MHKELFCLHSLSAVIKRYHINKQRSTLMREGCTASGPCTLDDFLEFERARIEAFQAYWLRCHELYPEQFPMTLDPGQWDEALMIFDISDSEPPDIDATSV